MRRNVRNSLILCIFIASSCFLPDLRAGEPENRYRYCDSTTFESLPSNLVVAGDRGRVDADIQHLVTADLFRELVVERMMRAVLREGDKPESATVDYNPEVDPYGARLRTPHGEYSVLLHEDADFADLAIGTFVPLSHGYRGSARVMTVGGKRGGEDGPVLGYSVGIHPELLLDVKDMRAGTREKAEDPAKPYLRSRERRLSLLHGLIRGMLRADIYGSPMLRAPGQMALIPQEAQRLSLQRLASLLPESVSDELNDGVLARAPRVLDVEPASTGKTVISALFLRNLVFGLGRHEEMKKSGLPKENVLGWDLDKSIVVLVAPQERIFETGMVETFRDALGIEDRRVLRAYGGRGHIKNLSAETQLVAILAASFSEGSRNRVFGAREIIARFREADRNIVIVFDESHHAANDNEHFVGVMRVANDMYTKLGKVRNNDPSMPNTLLYAMTATPWGNQMGHTSPKDRVQFLTHPDFFGFRSNVEPSTGHATRGKVVSGFLADADQKALQRAVAIEPVVELTLLGALEAQQQGYVSPITHVHTVDTWQWDAQGQQQVDARIRYKRLALEADRRDDKISEEEFRKTLNRHRLSSLLGDRPSVVIDEDGTEKMKMVMSPTVGHIIADFLLHQKNPGIWDRVVIKVAKKDTAEKLKIILEGVLKDETYSGYGEFEVWTYHGDTSAGSPQAYLLDWLNDRQARKKNGAPVEGFPAHHNMHKIAIVCDTLNEGVNINPANRVVIAETMPDDSASTLLSVIQLIQRVGRVSPFKTHSAVLDFSGAVRHMAPDAVLPTLKVPTPSGGRTVRGGGVESEIEIESTPVVAPHLMQPLGVRLAREVQTYEFKEEVASPFWRFAVSHTPFRDLNVEGMSGVGHAIFSLMSGLVSFDSSGRPTVNRDRLSRYLGTKKTNFERQVYGTALHQLVEGGGLFERLFDNFEKDQALRTLVGEAEALDRADIAAEAREELDGILVETERVWLAIRTVVKQLDPHRRDSVEIRGRNLRPNTGMKAVPTLHSFFSELVAEGQWNADIANGTMQLGAHTLKEHGLSAMDVEGDSEAMATTTATFSIKLGGGQNLYSLFHGERGRHKVTGFYPAGRGSGMSVDMEVEVSTAGSAELQRYASSADRRFLEVARRVIHGARGNFGYNRVGDLRDGTQRVQIRPFKLGEPVELDAEARLVIYEDLLLSQDYYLRAFVSQIGEALRPTED